MPKKTPSSSVAKAPASAPPLGLRARQKLETERLVKEAAFALFRTRGFDATTTKEIADAAGVAQGTVFSVAPTKEALLVAILEEKLRVVARARLASIPSTKPLLARLVHVFDGLFDFYAEEPALSRALLKGLLFPPDASIAAQQASHSADFMAALAALLAGAKSRGEIARAADVPALATTILAVYVFVLISFLGEREPDRRALGRRFSASLAIVLGGSTAP